MNHFIVELCLDLNVCEIGDGGDVDDGWTHGTGRVEAFGVGPLGLGELGFARRDVVGGCNAVFPRKARRRAVSE